MIEKFNFYVDRGLVKKGSPNRETASALMERAVARLDYAKRQKVGGAASTFIFEDIYESLREASQALMELKGYKPYSHEAQVSFVREFCDFPEHAVSTFDRFRVLRNKSVYGAARVSPETCREALGFAVGFLPLLKKEFEKEVKG